MSLRRCLLTLLVAVIGLALTACSLGTPTPVPDWMMSTATVERANMSESVAILGQVSPVDARELTFGVIDGRVVEVLVTKGQVVKTGDPLVRLDVTTLQRELREAEADLKVAQAKLDAAQEAPTEAELAYAEAQLAAAEQQVAATKLALDVAIEAGEEPYEQAVADKKVALQTARDNLAQQQLTANQSEIRQLEYQQAFFERTLRDLPAGDDSTEAQQALTEVKDKLAVAQTARATALSTASDAVAEAEYNVELAETALARVQSGEIDPLADERLAYERAAIARDDAQETLDDLRAGGDPDALSVAQTAYDAALAKVDSLKANIEAGTLCAPIDGAILDLYVAPNDWASASTVVAYLADPGQTHIQAQASELDIIHLAMGQSVRVSFDALPGTLATGTVTQVDVRGDTSSGLVTYPVEVVLDEPVEGLIQGMTATVRVLVGEREGVLAIPVAAVQYDVMGQSVVYVRGADDTWASTSVELGMNDGILVEVLSGLEEGQTVRIPVSIATPTPQDDASGVVVE